MRTTSLSVTLTQYASIDEVEEAEVLEEVVLDGGAREEDTMRGSQLGQRCVRLVLTVLQPVALQEDSGIIIIPSLGPRPNQPQHGSLLVLRVILDAIHALDKAKQI